MCQPSLMKLPAARLHNVCIAVEKVFLVKNFVRDLNAAKAQKSTL